MKKIIQACTLVIGFVTAIKAITYNVIADPPQNTNVVVVVDGINFPLKPEFGILYRGEAPSANVGYKYAFVDSANNEISEPFQRSLSLDDKSSSTPNEFFNRSINVYDVKPLPQAMPPLESIHRIKSNLHVENQIPTIHIYGEQSEIDNLHSNQLEDANYRLSVAFIGLKDVQVFDDVKVSLAGTNTRKFPKLSYGLKLDKKSDSNFFGYENIKLRSLVTDPSYIREGICHHVMESCGLAVSGFSYVRLFINNQAIGLFGLVETFQDPWTAAVFANGDTTYQSGYMYQGFPYNDIKHVETVTEFAFGDLRYESDLRKYSLGQYKIKTGPNRKNSESFQELQDFTKFIDGSLVGKTSQDKWEKTIDVNNLLRVLALDDLLGFTDNHVALGNNYYLYKNPKHNGRITFIPADFDRTLGRAYPDLAVYLNGNISEHPNLLFRPLTKALFANPSYMDSLKSIHYALAKSIVNSEVLNPYIDSIVEMIRADVEWDSRLKRVGKKIEYSSVEVQKIPQLEDLFRQYTAPGVFYGYGKTNQLFVSLDEAVGGGQVVNASLSVKEYISRKSAAVLQFYNNK